ncbi:unnamed protein product [Thlaspi arvense]|uniref:F-box domain-containing protein n=1 Tax=Thlaspi arvense TaxID=13288 RepID=A0AAU9R5R5_THLAR|nr:unnamed protein product [Thlaspi arvense]
MNGPKTRPIIEKPTDLPKAIIYTSRHVLPGEADHKSTMTMKLRLRRHETRETLKLELADTSTLNDLRRRINASVPSSVHLSLNRKDELLAPSPEEDTLRSLGVTSGDLIYYSLDRSAFFASVEEIGIIASSAEAHQSLAPNDDGESGGSGTTLGPQSEKNQAFVHDSMGIGFAATDVDMKIEDQSKTDEDSGEGSSSTGKENSCSEPMDVDQFDVELAAAGSKRLSEPFFLKKILLEKSGDTCEFTILAMSVHAVMLESGFVLYNHGSDKFSFSKELLSVSLRYTLPELITGNDTDIESVTVNFQSFGYLVLVHGSLSGYKGQRVSLDKRRFVPVMDLVLDTLKSDKQGSSSIYREVFMFWRMVKDGLAIPLLIGLCDKAGLELPPCLMRLPTELKLKIVESLPGASVARMACVCTEMRYLASDNDLWKQRCLVEAKHVAVNGSGDSVNWKEKFAAFWRQHVRRLSMARRTSRNTRLIRERVAFPGIIREPDTFGWFNGNHLHGATGRRQPARRLGGRGWGRGFSPRCNLGGYNQHGGEDGDEL